MNPILTHLSGARTDPRFAAVSVPMPILWFRLLSLRVCLRWISLILLSAASLASAAGNPGSRLALASSGDGVWRPGLTLAFRVTLEHPSVSGDADTGPWTLNPGAGWASAVTLQVKDPDGQTFAWPFERSALRETEALSLPAYALALVGFTWDPDGPDAAAPPATPGHYEVRARLAASDGTGWRGQVESEPVALEVRGPIPPLVHLEAPVTSVVHRGWPWGLRISIEQPDEEDSRRLALPNNAGELPSAVSLEVRDGQGNLVLWPLDRAPIAARSARLLGSGREHGSAGLPPACSQYAEPAGRPVSDRRQIRRALPGAKSRRSNGQASLSRRCSISR